MLVLSKGVTEKNGVHYYFFGSSGFVGAISVICCQDGEGER